MEARGPLTSHSWPLVSGCAGYGSEDSIPVSYEKFTYDHDPPWVGYGNHEQGSNLTLAILLRLLDIHGLTLQEFFDEL